MAKDRTRRNRTSFDKDRTALRFDNDHSLAKTDFEVP